VQEQKEMLWGLAVHPRSINLQMYLVGLVSHSRVAVAVGWCEQLSTLDTQQLPRSAAAAHTLSSICGCAVLHILSLFICFVQLWDSKCIQ
jgi:hypothetical protein